jgi:5-methylcytosine-specific restriction enzyme subunit McrC
VTGSPVVFQDLSPRTATDAPEDRWLARLAAHLENEDHVLRLAGGKRVDDEDEPALMRGADGNWWAGRFIGELRFEERELRIEPRLGIDVIGAWLAHALNLSIVPKAATSASQGPLIVQLIDRVWSAAVADAARHGGPRLRRTSHHDHVFVRGRVDVPATVRHRAARRPLVGTTRTERDFDNPVARVLVLADRALRSLLPATPSWRPTLTGELLGQLRGAVGSQPSFPDLEDLRRVRYSPITRRFESVALLSYEIARRRGHLTSASSADASGVLIDVAELWELFLVYSARRAFGPAHVEHGTAEREGTHLLRSMSKPGAQLGRLKPDILIRDSAGALAAVVDAKYKRLRSWRGSPSGVDRGDLYQLTSYLSGHDVPLGMLAYPPHGTDEAIADLDGPWLTRAGQETRFVRVPAIADDAIASFRALVAGPAQPSRDTLTA